MKRVKENMMNPQKLLMRVLIAIILIAFCTAMYPLYYCYLVDIC